jgi:hypothetical protein
LKKQKKIQISTEATEHIREQVEKDNEMDKRFKNKALSIMEVLNLSEDERKNLIIHGLEEAEGAEGRRRKKNDKKKLNEIFTILAEVGIASFFLGVR